MKDYFILKLSAIFSLNFVNNLITKNKEKNIARKKNLMNVSLEIIDEDNFSLKKFEKKKNLITSNVSLENFSEKKQKKIEKKNNIIKSNVSLDIIEEENFEKKKFVDFENFIEKNKNTIRFQDWTKNKNMSKILISEIFDYDFVLLENLETQNTLLDLKIQKRLNQRSFNLNRELN